ncbi:MAG: hypothetical protein QW568_01395 [Candidatus Anstonellaceae archaeon]
MRGQYFSFDAIVATVMIVIAISSLLGYWFSAQSIIESRANPMYADALRVSETLMSPGVPANWQNGDPNDIKEIGIGTGVGNELDDSKVSRLQAFADPSVDYVRMGRLLRTSGFNYYILINQSDVETGGYRAAIGNSSYAASSNVEVVVAHRGATIYDSATGKKVPLRVSVFLYR